MRRRIVDVCAVLWVVATLTFVLLHAAPGDPLSASLTDARVSPAIRAAWRSQLALDRPLPEQYARYLGSLAKGDLGYSFSRQRRVRDMLLEALPYSLALVGSALTLSVLGAMLLGTWLALAWGTGKERVVSSALGVLSGIPDAWLALLLLALLGVELGWLPLNGRCAPATCDLLRGWSAWRDVMVHAALPVLTLTLLFAIPMSRIQRVAVSTILHDEVHRTARAKGLTPHRILTHHIWRRTFMPLLTAVALSVPTMVGGAVVIERVFGWPGMGAVLVDAVAMRDYPVVMAGAILISLVVVLASIIAELCRVWFDPRAHERAFALHT
ncbi:MAG: ABC transporter permease [Gemmatimonadaceae bacterium]|nr:ABC transporter permease [Gemmatimonadaceae bacterium]